MRELLHRNKKRKGVSEMVSYVLLIIIAVGLSVLVYSYLKVYVPKDKAQCSQNISLILSDYYCDVAKQSLSVNLTNKGLFKIDAYYLRFDKSTKRIKPLLNNETIRFSHPNGDVFSLLPGDSFSGLFFSEAINESGKYELEIEPAIIGGKSGNDLA